MVTSSGDLASARAASIPPKPAPAMTTLGRGSGIHILMHHCEPSGLAFGEPKDKLREAIPLRLRMSPWRRLLRRAYALLAMTLLFYFSSSTRVLAAGAMPTMRMVASSSLAPSQCTCPPKWVTKVPGRIGTVLFGSHLRPLPTHQVPCSTVMKRSLGWKCGLLKLFPLSHLFITT